MRALTAAAVAALTVLAVSPTVAAGQDALDRARAAARTGDWDEALERFAAARGATAWREHARVLLTLGRAADALEIVSRGGGPLEGGIANLRGEALRDLGRLDEAERAFDAAEEAGGADRLTARMNRAELLWRRGEREEALALFDTFIDAYNRGEARSTDDLLAVGTAVRYLAVTNPDLFQDALMAFDEAADVAGAGTGDFRPTLRVGELFLDKYDAPEAHASFDRVLSVNPNHPDALVGKARTFRFDGDGHQAMILARRALDVAPDHAGAGALLARLHLASGAWQSARSAAEEVLERNPAHLEALSVLAAAHYLRGDSTAWRTTRDRAMEAHPGFAGFFITLAEIVETQRRYHAAAELAAEAVERDPDHPAALGTLAMNELRIGRLDEGREHLARAFDLDPYNPWYKNTLDLLDTFGRYETVRTEHFELVLHGDEAELLGPYATTLAEEAYEALAARYGTEPPAPVRVEIFPSHADFSVRTLGIPGLGALGVSFGSTLVMDSPSAREPGDFNWASTLWHELAHAFHLGMTDHRVPRWFSEGLAVHEQRTARHHWGMGPTPSWLRSYHAGGMPPVSRLDEAFVRPTYPGQVVHAYYQSSLVFEMLEERWGFEPVLAMLRGYRDGATTDELVSRTLGVEPAELDRLFDAWVRERFGDRMAAVTVTPGSGEGSGEGTDDGPGESPHGTDAIGVPAAGDLAGLRRAALRRPGSYPARLTLGRALLEAGELDEAEDELRAALRLFPEHGSPEGPLSWLARIHEERGERTEAAAALQALGLRGESLWRVHAGEARLRLEVGDTAAAVAALEKAVEIVPFDTDLHEALARAYRSVGNTRGEVRERTALLALDPADRAGALYRLALAHHRDGDAEAARRRVLQALEIAPSYDDALELLLELRGGEA